MKKLLVRLVRQSPAMIVAMLALFVALTGTAVATTSALIGSAQIRNNSITGIDVKNRSLRPIDFRGSVRGPRGLRGLQGIQGVQGPPGAPNPNAVNSDLLDNLDSGDFVKKAETFTGHFSCAGSAWESAFSTTTYSTSGSQKYATSASALFRCSVELPHGATITALNCSVRDTSATETAGCALWRTNMSGGAVGTETSMASVSTGAASAVPGNTRLTDVSITVPGVDNDNFSYFVQSSGLGTDTTTGIFGTNITYTVSGAQGAAAVAEPTAVGAPGLSTE